MKQWISFAGLLLSTLFSAAQNPPSQRELNGILLGQRREVMIAEFGKPFSSAPNKDDGGIQEAYAVSPDQKTYMACEYSKKGNEASLLLQLTGNPNPKTLPFLGLRLGDPKEKVMKALGKPRSREPEADFPVELWQYDNRNYSVEIDRSGKLYSIRIVNDYGFPESPSTPIPNFERFRAALQSGNVDRILETLSGDLAFFPEGRSFSSGARKELTESRTKFSSQLSRVRSILSDPSIQAEPNIRLREHENPETVFKFSSSNLDEIVFRWEAGAWRVYEISMKSE